MSNDWEKTNILIGISVFVKMKTWALDSELWQQL